MKIWKIAHGNSFFDDATHKKYINNQVISMHPNTAPKGQSSKSQGENFTSQDRYLDIFYVCKGNELIDKIGIFCTIKSQLNFLDEGDDWHVRKFITLFEATTKKPYQGEQKWWTPNNNSTFTEIPNKEYKLFEKLILRPYFNISLNELMQKYDKVKDKIQKESRMKENIQKYLTLLEQQKNIVLTGSPGTGKTYLAKEIARKLTQKEIKGLAPIDYIKDYYETNKEQLIEEDKQQETKRQEFLQRFPIDDIENMTLDDYCMGDKGNYPDNFSRWIEFILKPLGYMGSGTSSIHIVYKKGNESFNVDNYEDLFPKILEGIREIATTGKYTGELPLRSNWIMKIANSYNNSKYFPVYTRPYLNNICEIFNIEKSKDVYQMNKNILEFFEM